MNASGLADRAAPWACIALFFARITGQFEVLLLAPDWLPAMGAWSSGLVPYAILLPVQIVILLVMCAVVVRSPEPAGRSRVRVARTMRALALLYFLAMALRLGWIIHLHGGQYYLNGAIPVAFHWVLALFVLLQARRVS